MKREDDIIREYIASVLHLVQRIGGCRCDVVKGDICDDCPIGGGDLVQELCAEHRLGKDK